jgi:two-component system cell cycle sensor histidine kinase/response regulator CckA
MREQPHKFMNLPDRKTHTTTPEPTVQRISSRPGVLVVDDEHMVRIMVQLSLERNGFEVFLASNGREAIDLFRAHREEIAVVLLDVLMPGLDGVQTLNGLRELDCEVPACFMSSNTGADKPDELLQCGAAYIFAKPFRPDALASILRLLTNGAPAELLPSGCGCQQ